MRAAVTAGYRGKRIAVRINGAGSAHQAVDIEALAGLPIDAVVLPKVDAVADRGAGGVFQPVEALRHPAPNLEIAAIDAARFPNPAPRFIRSLRPGVPGHACNQNIHSIGRNAL